eukprot:gene801-biopygen70
MFFQNSPLPTDSIVNAHCEHGTVSADPREAGRAFIARLAATATNHGEIASTSPAQPYGHVLLPLQPAMHPTPNATPHRTAAGICIHPQPGDELNAAIPTGNESLCYNSIDVEEHRSLPRLPRRCSPPHITPRQLFSASVHWDAGADTSACPILARLRSSRDVPPQPNSRPDSVFGTDRPANEALMPESGP